MRRATRLLTSLLLSLALSAGSTVAAQPLLAMPRLALAIPGKSSVKANPVLDQIFQVTTTVTVTNKSDAPVRKLQLTIPPTVHGGVEGQTILNVTYDQEPSTVRQTPSGPEVTYLVPEVRPGQILTFDLTYTVQVGETNKHPATTVDPLLFLGAESGIEVDHPAIQAKARQLTAGYERNDEKALALLQFVSHNLRYDLSSSSRNKGALAGLQSGSGVCSEYANLFVALARASGIPARLVYGWANDTGLKSTLDGSQRHLWAEYYLAGRGWIPVDPTFASVLPAEQAAYFDPSVHLAQDWRPTAHAASYAGRGLLTITTTHQLVESSVVASN